MLERKLLLPVGVATILFVAYNWSELALKQGVPVPCDLYSRRNEDKIELDPWKDVPEFTLYLRLTSNPRFIAEYRADLLRTMKVFFPAKRSKLLLVLDNEKQEDHSLGDELKNEWPYPDVCYRDPGDPGIYHNWGKARMYWDMMYPDACTNVSYVGFVDTDTFFTTLVTPDLLFENGKPVIVAKIGQPPYQCWENLSEVFLGRKAVMQCMSVFPLMIKTSHMKEMREVLAKEQKRDFDFIFRDSAKGVPMYCMCQFSLMCNYVWYKHRDEYAWHLQMVPDGNWSGQSWVPSMVPVDYYTTEVKLEEKIPIPRTSIHLRYTITNGKGLLSKEPPKEVVESYFTQGLCYSGGFDRCPEKCKNYARNEVQYNLYSFEFYQWFWDKRCLAEQQKHFKKVNAYLRYYEKTKKPITLYLISTDDICTLI